MASVGAAIETRGPTAALANNKAKDANADAASRNTSPAAARNGGAAASPALPWRERLPPRVSVAFTALQRALDSDAALALTVALTLAALFLDNIRVAACAPAADPAFFAIAFGIFCFFLLELLLSSLVSASYCFGFFFWLDLVAAVSLIPDIPFLWLPMKGLRADDAWASAAQVERAALVSAASESYAGLEQFLRLLRLVRIAKLFEIVQRKAEEYSQRRSRPAAASAMGASGGGADVDGAVADGSGDDGSSSGSNPRPVQVGQHLSEQTTRKVVLLVLLMLFGVPLLQPRMEERAEDYTLQELHTLASSNLTLGAYNGPVYEEEGSSTVSSANDSGHPHLTPGAQAAVNATMSAEVEWVRAHYDGTLLFLRLHGSFAPAMELSTPELHTHRTSEVKAVQVDGGEPADGGISAPVSMALFSVRSATRRAGLYNILTTLAVLLLLGLGAVLFNRNNHRMVIVPIERMMATIVSLQQNPLARAARDSGGGGGSGADGVVGGLGALGEHLGIGSGGGAGGGGGGGGLGGGQGGGGGGMGGGGDHNNETSMLERTLEKLTSLLLVGFGEAGNAMISKCMNFNDAGDLNPLVDGSKMLAIYGFCDIRRFTDATELLREDVMMYVNEIAAIVHQNVSDMDGSPNKNIGDAFLVVWRLPAPQYMDADDLFQINENQPRLTRPTLQQVRRRTALQKAIEEASSAEEAAAAAAPEQSEENDEAEVLSSSSSSSPSPPIVAPTAASIGVGVGGSTSLGALLVEQALEAEQEAKEAQVAYLDRAKKAGASIPPLCRPLHPSVRQQISVLADKALVSFLRIIAEIQASEEVRKYARHPRILEAFRDTPGGFQVALGFGLHCGWAIEGPIGSRYKIDASYLSPHVNLSETLQDATKIYQTPLLLSGEFYSLLSPYLKSYCRRIDVVKVSGREAPINLYTFDIHPLALEALVHDQVPEGYDLDADANIAVVELQRGRNALLADYSSATAAAAAAAAAASGPAGGEASNAAGDADSAAAAAAALTGLLQSDPLSPGGGVSSNSGQFVHELFRNPYLNAHVSNFSAHSFDAEARRLMQERGPIGSYHTVRSSTSSPLLFRLSALQCGIPRAFFDMYAAALELYLDGEWPSARQALLEAQRLYPEDGPTKVLLDVMKAHHYVAPTDWAGWHEV